MKRFTNILVLCDRELQNTQALESAIQIAEENNASITLLLVLPPLTALQTFAKTQTPEQIQQSYQQHYLNNLQQFSTKYADQALIRCKVVVGTSFIETIRAVLRNQHDLVVKVAEPASWIQRLLGSNDMHLLRKCPCPLWILKPGAPSHGRKVVATVDIEPQGMLFNQSARHEDQLNQQIVELAAATATMHQASLDFLHAWQPQDAGLVLMWCDHPEQAQLEVEQSLYQSQLAGLDRFKQQVQAWLSTEAFSYLQPRFSLLRGEPSQVLVDKIKDINPDLVVMGTVGRSGIAGLLIGNTAETILEQLNCAVLAVKPAGFICPIQLVD